MDNHDFAKELALRWHSPFVAGLMAGQAIGHGARSTAAYFACLVGFPLFIYAMARVVAAVGDWWLRREGR